MPSDLEGFVFDGLDLNDGTTWSLESLDFRPAQKKLRWASNADASGDALVDESHYENAKFTMQLRLEPQETMAVALEKVGTLMDKIQECHDLTEGAELEWIPHTTETTYTWYALVAEVEELPITVEGSLAGWFLNAPVLKVVFTCKSFGYKPKRVALEATEGEGPLQTVYVSGVKGDVPAEGELIVTDKVEGGQQRRYMDWGLEQVESEEGNPDLLLEADEDLTVEGYTGELAEQEGSHSTKVVKATLTPTALVLCSTGSITHIGPHKLKLRCQVDGEGALLRASYRVGDSSWTTLPWVRLPFENAWCEIGLGEALLEEAEKGEQISEIRIEGKVEEDNCTGYIDLLAPMPARRYGVARAPLDLDVPTTLSVGDSFNQSEGNATGKEAEVGGTYAAIPNSDTTDFTIAGGKLKRTAVSDTGTIGTAPRKGRAIGTAVELANPIFEMSFYLEPSGESWGFGQIVNYVDNTHFVLVFIIPVLSSRYLLVKDPAGTNLAGGSLNLELAQFGLGGFGPLSGALRSVIDGEMLTVYIRPTGGSWQKAVQLESELLSGEGKLAIYDANTAAIALTREYDNLAVWEPDQPVVCPAEQSLEIRHDGAERENSGGTYWSPVPVYRGSHFLLPPEGDSEQLTRLVARMRRNDSVAEADIGLTDAQSLEVLARERFLAPK